VVATIRFHETGGSEVLRREELPVRPPGPGEVRLRVQAIGLNRADVNFRRGTYPIKPVLPAGLGVEATGVILELGPEVDRWAVGDAVCVLPASSPNEHPLYAEEAVVPASALVARPPGQDAVSAAATWMPYLTVFGMVAEAVRVRPGDRVLVTAAANSIGMAALQVLGHLGAIVVATADPAHHAALRELGAAAVLDGPAPDAVRAAFGGHDADLVLDAVGGPGVHGLVDLCRSGGTLLVHGGLSGEPTPLPDGARPVWVRRYHVYEVTRSPEVLRRAEHLVRAGLAAGTLVPLVDRTFDFHDLAQVAAAHDYLESPQRGPGKPVLVVARDRP
jgi:NADPH:quinone reductase-like Zn-dependent oxidoreductase